MAALALVVADGRPAAVHLHPDDLAVVEAAMQGERGADVLRWIADPQIERGGCRVRCGQAEVDAGMASRWQRVLANLGLETAWEPAQAGGAQGDDDQEGEGDADRDADGEGRADPA